MKHPSTQSLRSVPLNGDQLEMINTTKLRSDAAAESMDPANDIKKENLIVVRASGRRHLVLSEKQLNAIGIEHKVICYADFATQTLKKGNGGYIRNLPKQGTLEFLEGLATGLGFADTDETVADNDRLVKQGPSTKVKESDSTKAAPESAPAIAESREDLTPELVQKAVSKALKYVSNSMDKNIDHWVTEAGSLIVQNAATKHIAQDQRMLSIARQLPSSSANLRKHFQSRLVESLQKFNRPVKQQASLDLQNLQLAEDKHWDNTAITKLSATVDGEALINFNQLNRRFSYLLNRRISPTKNVFGPEVISSCLCSALNDMSYSREQAEVLYSVMLEVFPSAMEEIYREVNLLWIEMKILPAIQLRVRHDDYKRPN